MSEFKFNCPQCKQHIACDTTYVGSQINCPACRQAIMVPPLPPMVAAPGERTIQIKVSTLRKASLIGLCVLLVAGITTTVLCVGGDSTRAIWTVWSVLDGDESNWSFSGGKIHAHSESWEGIFASDKEYGDVTFSATVSTTNREASLAIRLQDAGNGYLILFAPSRTHPPGFISVVKKTSGHETTLNKRALSASGPTANVKVVARGPLIDVYLNGKKVLHVSDSTYAAGRIGLRLFGDPNHPCDSVFSNVTFR
jgi:DNA-directed RNA polymerase subunit RPC12/RpoP